MGDVIEDGHGNAWVRCSPSCDMEVVRPGKVQCSCDEETVMLGDEVARLTRERDEVRRDLYRVADALDCTIDADGVGSIAAPIDEVVQAARDAARAAQERDEARAEVERLRAVVDTVAAEVAATLEAYRGGQSAGSPPLPLSVAQRWARTLASAETVSPTASVPRSGKEER